MSARLQKVIIDALSEVETDIASQSDAGMLNNALKRFKYCIVHFLCTIKHYFYPFLFTMLAPFIRHTFLLSMTALLQYFGTK